MLRLFGRGSVYTLVLGMQMLSGFLVLPVLTRLLAPAAYGQVAAALVVSLAVSIIAGAGLPDAAARVFFGHSGGASGPDDARRLISSLLWIAPIVGLAADLTGPLWAPALGLHYGSVLRVGVWCGAAGALLSGAQALLRVAERVWSFLIAALVAVIGGQGLGVTLAAIEHSATAYMTGIMIAMVLAAAVALLISGTLRMARPRLRELRRGLAVGLPIVPHSLAVAMLAAADRVLIVALLGLRAAGRYQVAYAIGGVGVAVITAINQAWLPLSLGARAEQRWDMLTATSRVVHLAAGIVAVTLALLAPVALVIAAPASYGRSALVPVVAVVALSALPYATCGTYFQVVLVSGRTRIMALAAPIAATVNVVLNLLLLHPLGLVGAAIATVAGYVLMAAIIAARARRIVGLTGAGRDALIGWVLATPFIAAGALLPTSPAGVTARVAAGLVAAALLPVLFRAARPTPLSAARTTQAAVPLSR